MIMHIQSKRQFQTLICVEPEGQL